MVAKAVWISVVGAMLSSAIALPAHGQAQSPADEFSRRQSQQSQSRRLDNLKRITPGGTPDAAPAAAPAGATDAGICFHIARVGVEGATRVSPADIAKITDRYRDRCIGLADINTALRDLTHLYLDRGYVTSRAYVPQQDIKGTGLLRLVMVEGTISDIYVNGKKPRAGGAVAAAFPGVKDSVANIRDVEQGLDQINRLSSNNAKTSMLPGPKDGTTILNVENNPGKRWHMALAHDNLGQESTGYAETSLQLGLDDALGINDQLGLSYQRSGPDYPWGGDGHGSSNSYSFNTSVPHGYWTVSATGSWYTYRSSIAGKFRPIDTSGNSGQAGFGVDRVVFRDQASITTLRTKLTYKQTDNFLLGNRIEVGSRRYSVGTLGLSHSRRLLGGVWAFDAAVDHGLDLFDAVHAGDPGAGDANPRFSKYSATLSVTEPFALAGQSLEFTTTANAQYSPDNLFGAEQISLGGPSNVRGMRQGALYGNNGVFVRNELALRLKPWDGNAEASGLLGELRPYVGLDYGHVYGQSRFDIAGGDLAGWTAGGRLVGGRLNLDLGYSDVLAGSAGSNTAGLFYVSTSMHW